MPTDIETRALRQNAILMLVSGETPIRTQGELVRLLAEKGIHANQSSVSRDLRDLHIVRVRGEYSLGTWDPLQEAMEFFRMAGFIRRAKPAGPNLTVVSTRPGAAPVVGRAIEEEDWPDVVGIISVDSTVFIATVGGGQEQILQRIDSLRRSMSPGLPRLERPR